MEINLSDTPSVLFRDGHRCYTNNGSVIFGFHVHLREIYSNSEKDFDTIHDIWYNALRDFEEGTIISLDAFKNVPSAGNEKAFSGERV